MIVNNLKINRRRRRCRQRDV